MDYMNQDDQMVKDSSFVKTGGQAPGISTSIDLDEMFKMPKPSVQQSTTPQQSGTPQVGTFTFDDNDTAQSVGASSYLDASGDWTKVSGPGGDYYMPSAGQQGDFHEGPGGELYEWQEGKGWVNLEGGAGGDVAAQRLSKYKGQLGKNTFHVAANTGILTTQAKKYGGELTGIVSGYLSGYMSGTVTPGQVVNQINAHRDQAIADAVAKVDRRKFMGEHGFFDQAGYDRHVNAAKRAVDKDFDAMEDAARGAKKASDWLRNQAASMGIDVEGLDLATKAGAEEAKRLIGEKIGGQDYQGLMELQGKTVGQDMGTQVSELLGKVDSGEFSFYNADGDLDIEGLKAQGGAQAWLGETLEKATASGFLEDDFTQTVTDPLTGEKTKIFNDDIQGVMDSMDDSLAMQQTKFMKDLRLSAAQQGISPEDVIFSQRMQQYETEATAQFANEFAQMMGAEMEAAYTSIGNSLASMLERTKDSATATSFRDEFERQKSEAMKDYLHQAELMANEMSIQKKDNRANVITGLVSAAGAATMVFGDMSGWFSN